VVTSPTGAAIADFLETFLARWRACDLIVVPSRVQGAGAAEELARALATAGRLRPAVDAIALIRGGGSLEDLWAFNEEVLVRAVAASPVPVVSGVGHEIDVSLADLAADVRALTPTDAAVRIAPDGRQLAASLVTLDGRLRSGLDRRIERVGLFARSRVLADPSRLVQDRRAAIDQHASRLQRLASTSIERAAERLGAAVGRLEAGSPLKILARGYSVTSLAEGTVAMTSTAGVKAGDTLVTQLSDGRVWSNVTRTDAGPMPR
jgi:exodeoxyribonuclease VII large subunit